MKKILLQHITDKTKIRHDLEEDANQQKKNSTNERKRNMKLRKIIKKLNNMK